MLNLKNEDDTKKMRAIAEAAFAMVREYKGSHSGEHGDGLVRSEFHEPMFGKPLVNIFKDVKDTFDNRGILNPGKIVDAPQMDNRKLFRFKLLDVSFYKGPMGAGTISESSNVPAENWTYPLPDSVLEVVLNQVCSP